MTDAVLTRARAGDERAFAQLTTPLRRELQVHCYRMLGSVQDAEDAVQETLMSAWRGLDSFAGRSSLRAWLYGIATHRCLNHLRTGSRRPHAVGSTLPFTPPPATRMSEASWLTPLPESFVEELADLAPGPEARYEQRESVGLAFISALQRLPERQRAVLVLRDVLGYHAAEVAELLGVSEATVTSALQRARAALRERGVVRERAPAPESAAERELVGRFIDAFETGDIDRVVAMLSQDAWVTMPPEPFEYQGRAAIAAFLTHTRVMARPGRSNRFVAMRANGQPAFAHYVGEPGGAALHLSGMFVLELAGEQITLFTRFALGNLPAQFELPATLEA